MPNPAANTLANLELSRISLDTRLRNSDGLFVGSRLEGVAGCIQGVPGRLNRPFPLAEIIEGHIEIGAAGKKIEGLLRSRRPPRRQRGTVKVIEGDYRIIGGERLSQERLLGAYIFFGLR